MKFTLLVFLTLFLTVSVFSQRDSLQIGDKYWEDQLYIDVTYNLLANQPKQLGETGFSYGVALGYMKDIPFNKTGKTAFAVGLGYSHDSFSHGLRVLKGEVDSYEVASDIISNKIKLHNLEMPIQFRWRSSDANTYSFWRFYAGVKIVYNLSNNYIYQTSTDKTNFSNAAKFNTWQTGLTVSAGYGTFNFHVYYGLTPMFKGVKLNNEAINSKVVRLGLSFYLL